jgi:hypothetical protein
MKKMRRRREEQAEQTTNLSREKLKPCETCCQGNHLVVAVEELHRLQLRERVDWLP